MVQAHRGKEGENGDTESSIDGDGVGKAVLGE